MRTLYQSYFVFSPPNRWWYSRCCQGEKFFKVQYLESCGCLELSCNQCGKPHLRIAVQPLLQPLDRFDKVSFRKDNQGRVEIKYVPLTNTPEWHREVDSPHTVKFYPRRRRLISPLKLTEFLRGGLATMATW